MMVDAARRLVEKHIQPILDANDRDSALPKPAILKVMEKAAELGLTSARIPEEGGGAGLRMLDYGLIGEQMPASVALILQPHEATTTRIFFGCSEEQKERYLGDLMAGRRIACTGSSFVRAAASSMASGRPSSRRHTSATVRALPGVSAKRGVTARARCTNRATEGTLTSTARSGSAARCWHAPSRCCAS